MKLKPWTIYVYGCKNGETGGFGFLDNGERIGMLGKDKNKVIECIENGFNLWKEYGKEGIRYDSLLLDIEKVRNSPKNKFEVINLKKDEIKALDNLCLEE